MLTRKPTPGGIVAGQANRHTLVPFCTAASCDTALYCKGRTQTWLDGTAPMHMQRVKPTTTVRVACAWQTAFRLWPTAMHPGHLLRKHPTKKPDRSTGAHTLRRARRTDCSLGSRPEKVSLEASDAQSCRLVAAQALNN